MLKFYDSIRNKLADNKIINKLIIIYAFTVLSYQILHLIVPFRQLIVFLHLSSLSSVLAVVGFGIFVWDLLIDRVFLKTKFVYPLIAILGLMLISTFLRRDYGIISNLKVIIWQISQLLVIFPLYNRIDKAALSKLIGKYFFVISVIFVVTNIIGLVQFFTVTRYEAWYDGGYIRQGFSEGRLFGVYASPHYGSLFVLVLSAGSVYYAVGANKLCKKIVCYTAALIHFLYAVASGTRSVIIGTAATLCLISFLISWKRFGARKINAVLRAVICVALAIVVAVGSVGLFTLTDKAMHSILYAAIDEDEISKEEENLELERTDVDFSNISNHRFEIWKNYFQAVSARVDTLLFGMSPGSYMSYVKDNFPDLFIVEYIKENYPRMYEKNLIYDTHNAYFGALATTGVIGVLMVFTFLIFGFVRSARFILKSRKVSAAVYAIISVVVFILITSFFDTDIFFKCTSTSVIFWLTTGMLLKFTSPNEIKE